MDLLVQILCGGTDLYSNYTTIQYDSFKIRMENNIPNQRLRTYWSRLRYNSTRCRTMRHRGTSHIVAPWQFSETSDAK